MIVRYVAEGFGVGLVLIEPGVPTHSTVRMLPLNDFPMVPYGLLWTGLLSALQSAFMNEAQMLAESLSRAPALQRAAAESASRARPNSAGQRSR